MERAVPLLDQPVYGPTLNMQAVHLERNRRRSQIVWGPIRPAHRRGRCRNSNHPGGLDLPRSAALGPPAFLRSRQHTSTSGRRATHCPYLYDNTTVARTVNDWLRTLEVPYELDVVPVQVAGATQLGDLVAVTLTDVRSRVTVTPADVGFGISQVLPIVVLSSALDVTQ